MESQNLSHQTKCVCVFVLLQIRNKILSCMTQLKNTTTYLNEVHFYLLNQYFSLTFVFF